MLQDELAHLVDGLNAIEITIAMCVSPCKQAVPAKDKAIRSGIFFDRIFNQKREFEAGALPGHPNDLAIEGCIELLQLFLAVGAGCKRDSPIGMQMVDMIEGEEGMQRRINGGRNAIFSEC